MAQESLAGTRIRLLKFLVCTFLKICHSKNRKRTFSTQSGAFSRLKNGYTYFSAISRSIQDPIAVPGPCDIMLVGTALAPTLFTASAFQQKSMVPVPVDQTVSHCTLDARVGVILHFWL